MLRPPLIAATPAAGRYALRGRTTRTSARADA
jgi:hypothetical protein